ncbi:MAG: transglycosylase SLT domain-containing protein [Janthinobacterium lividum]
MRPTSSQLRVIGSVTAVALLSACASTPQFSAQQESRSYLSRAGRTYTPPGSADDPWGPYISEAAKKYDVPERWIREVMRQESGGRLYGRSGTLVTSGAGAMGLMQVMPGTYDELRARYSELGDDPYDPHNNILAGTAYIREMYDIYGSPGFLAAYNAGPGRLDDYLTRSRILPVETRRYVASIGPRLGSDSPNRPSPGEQYAMNSVPLAIPDGPRYASASAPIRASVPAYSTAVAAVLNPASAEPVQTASDGYVQGGPIRLSPQREGAPAQAFAAAEPIRLQPQTAPDPASFAPAEPIRLSPQPDVEAASLAPAEPIRLRPQPVQVAAAEELPQPSVPVQSSYVPPATPRQAFQSARLPEPPPPPRPVQAAQASRSPMVVPPEPPRQYAAVQAPFGPAPRPLGFSLISHANAEPVMPRHTGALTPVAGNWAVQVGAFANQGLASAATQSARGQAREVLAYAHTVVAGVRQPGGVLYRARLTGLSHDAAAQACERLQRSRTKCMVVSPDAQS